MQVPRQPQRQEDKSSDRTDALSGGYCRGHLGARILWHPGHGPLARPLSRPVVAHLHVPGLWWGLGHGPSHHHDLLVAHWGDRRQALCTLLGVPRLPPLHPTLATLGGRHPPGGPVGRRGRSHARHRRRDDQAKSRYASRRARPLPPWRRLRKARRPDTARRARRLRPHAPAPHA
jgi:hypothetical protein